MSDISDILRIPDSVVWFVSAEHEGKRAGLIATFVSSASIVPELPRVVVGIAKQHHTWGLIEASRAFTLHILDESHLDWVWRFGLLTGHAVDKYAGMRTLDPVAWLKCRVETTFDTGDRTLYLAEVVDGKREKKTSALTMSRLLQLASPERLAQMRAGLERDAKVDAAAIRLWRNRPVG